MAFDTPFTSVDLRFSNLRLFVWNILNKWLPVGIMMEYQVAFAAIHWFACPHVSQDLISILIIVSGLS